MFNTHRFIKNNKELPLKKTLKAMVVDHRNNAQLHGDEYVGVFILLDEHQLLYDGVKIHLNLSVEAAVEMHKSIFSELMQLKADQDLTAFCLEERLFLMPLFSGTHHNVLKALTESTYYDRTHIPLNSFCVETSRNCLLENLNFIVDTSWLNYVDSNRFNNKDRIPLNAIIGEVMAIPRQVIVRMPSVLQTDMCKELLKTKYSVFNFKKIIKEIHQYVNKQLIDKTKFTNYLTYAACSGYYLTENELEDIKQDNISDLSFLNASKKFTFAARILIMPALLVQCETYLPHSFKSYLKLDYINADEQLQKQNQIKNISSFSKIWEHCNADRIGMVFLLRKFLQKDDVTIENLFGEKSINLTPNNYVFETQFSLPEVAQKVNGMFYCDINEAFLLNKHGTVSVNKSVFEKLRKGKKKWVTNFIKTGLAYIGANSHPIADILCYLKPLDQKKKKVLVWISVKGSQDGDTPGVFKLNKTQVKSDVTNLNRIQEADELFVHALVYVTSNFQNDEDIERLKNEIENDESITVCNIGVLLVHDMSDLFPLFAHRCTYVTDFEVLRLNNDNNNSTNNNNRNNK
jgi:hypothetical protein